MNTTQPSKLSDQDLLLETRRAVMHERRATADLLALLAELDSRRLYLGEGCSSLFTYCLHVLHLSEPAAYSRITAARASRRFPAVLPLLTGGEITLTTIGLLAPHLTDENHEAVLAAARHRTKREVECLVAALEPSPDVPSSVRKAPVEPQLPTDAEAPPLLAVPAPESAPITAPRAVVAPLAPERYLIKVTVSAATHAKLERARDLLRHRIPNGDPAAIIDEALTALVDRLEAVKLAATRRPRQGSRGMSTSRHVPAAVKRAVWARDQGRCAFTGSEGRCVETGFLEFHHMIPFAAGGPTAVDNLELRCRAHNVYEAERVFGPRPPQAELYGGSS